jgi:hypothetical protein
VALSDAQQDILAKIAQVAPQYKDQSDQLVTSRTELYGLIKEAVALKLTTYQVAEAALLSQPRISQIVRSPDALEET